MTTTKSRRVSVSAPLFERLEKVAADRLIGTNLIVEKAVERYVDEMEKTPPALP